MTYSLKLTGFKTKEQVEALLDWYEGSGEQQAGDWLENQDVGATFMPVNLNVPYSWNDTTLTAELRIFGDIYG